MSLITAASDYLNKIIRVPGMKALLLDAETSVMVGLCYSLSSLIQQQVFLTERIDTEKQVTHQRVATPSPGSRSIEMIEQKKEEKMHHLKAMVFVRPTTAVLSALRLLLASHRFKHIHVYFTAIVSDDYLHQLAEADVYSLIETIHEYYLDYYVLHAHLFHVNQLNTRCLFEPYSYWLSREKTCLQRHVSGIVSVLLATKKQVEIRYTAQSEVCRLLSTELYRLSAVEERELFTFSAQHIDPPPLLLVLDRRNDPITPLLLQWTYTAMVHELLTITNNRIDMSHTPGIRSELHEIVLSPDTDHFYKGSMTLNFGDLGASIKDLVSDFQRKTHNTTKLDSIEAMQRFVDHYPEFRSLSGTVSKHVAVVSELSRIIEARRLMLVSETEQELACNEDIYAANTKVEKLCRDTHIQFDDALRVVMLYALRYEDDAQSLVVKFRHLLREKAGTDREKRRRVQLVDDIIKYAGQKKRSIDLYGSTKSFLGRASQLLNTGIRGIENIYTQHKPVLADILNSFLTGRATAADYPAPDNSYIKPTYKTLIVYIIGGCTYEESAYVETINKGFMADILDDSGSSLYRDNTLLEEQKVLDSTAADV